MKLIVCDKNKNFLKKFKKILETFMIEKKIIFEIYMYDNIYNYIINNSFSKNDLIFIGEISNDDEIINHLLNSTFEPFLVIMSNYENFNVNYLKINTFGYILKNNITLLALEKIIGSIYFYYVDNSKHIFITKDGIATSIKISDIIYVGILDRHVYLMIKNDKQIILRNRAFSELKINFLNYSFFQIYRAMYVNRKYIKKVHNIDNNFQIELKNNQLLGVSKSKQKEIKEFFNYSQFDFKQ